MTSGADPAHPTGAAARDHPPDHSPTGAPASEPGAEVDEEPHAVPDRIDVSLPADSLVLVTSDLHLRQAATSGSLQIEQELVARLSTWEGPGVVVLNGDLVELWGEPEGTVMSALDAHPALTTALAEFAAGEGRQVIVVVGDHDAPMAWDGVSARTMSERLGARTALSVDLEFDTPAGRRVVRCEHGHAFDPANALSDPRNPLDSPLGQHVVQQVLPAVTRTPLMADLGALADPSAAGRFVASRLVYRQLGGRAWWLLLPLLVLLLRLPLVVRVTSRSDEFGHAQRWLLITGLGLLAETALLSALVILVARTVYSSMGAGRLGPWGAHANGAPRTAATAVCSGGLAGLVTGHTHQPELAAIPGGFYANSGCGLRHVEARSGRFGLPPVFTPVLRRSWVEIDVVHDLRVRLLLAETPTGEATRLERLAARRQATRPGTPQVVATLPGEAGWPLPQDRLQQPAQRQRTRRIAATAISVLAMLGLVSALTLPLRFRLRDLLEVLPVQLPQTAAASLVFACVALLLLARGLRRGSSLALTVTLGLLVITAVLHLAKGIDVEETLATLLVAGWLARHRRAFRVHPDSRQLRRAAALSAVTGLFVIGMSIALVIATGQPRATGATARAAFLTPALWAVGLSLLLPLGWLLTQPRLRREPTPGEHRADLAHARRLVSEYGGDTLGYFALRGDKSWFFTDDCVVAYAVRGGVCLVSPDPVGPPEQWPTAWAEFTAFADRHGWSLAVLGAGAGWLPIYEAAGLRPVYIGDEAIVNCPAFTLEGRAMKGLRSAYRRVQRAGYMVRFYDPARMPPTLAGELRALMTQSRQGDIERGFSMTLSRLFDPDDTGLLLAVAHGPDGKPAGFCHFVPANDISGWSLDVMRRSVDTDLPNGLTDYILVETINHLTSQGQWGLGLNFAVMRAVLAGEQDDGPLSDLERRVLHRFSDSMQIESLWRYNEKFQPLWRPRYAVLSGIGGVPAQGLAIAEAEGIAELPLVGALLSRRTRRRATRDAPAEREPSQPPA